MVFVFYSVPRPIRIPTSVKLIFIMKTDPSNRFILKGDTAVLSETDHDSYLHETTAADHDMI